MLKILIAPDSFKDCLSAVEVVDNIAKGIVKAVPDSHIVGIPLSDGGEGLLPAIMAAKGGRLVEVEVLDPLMRRITARFGILEDQTTAIIEMAQASGLELLQAGERNPMHTSTFGTGQLIHQALDRDCRKFIIGIGGSATNDGGSGMAQALGARLKKADGTPIEHGGKGLDELHNIDLSALDDRIEQSVFEAACDVKNPLTGSNGASAVYGPQKGATPEMVQQLDRNLDHYASVIFRCLGKDLRSIPGAGAAGGMGVGLMAFLNAELKSGFEIVKELVGLERAIQQADLVITGEGKIDRQTKFGKTPFGVASIAKKFNKPVIAFAGTLGEGIEDLFPLGFIRILPISETPMELQDSIKQAPRLLQAAAERALNAFSANRG